jgi:hypothetical protein
VLKSLDMLLMGHTTVPVPEEHSLTKDRAGRKEESSESQTKAGQDGSSRKEAAGKKVAHMKEPAPDSQATTAQHDSLDTKAAGKSKEERKEPVPDARTTIGQDKPFHKKAAGNKAEEMKEIVPDSHTAAAQIDFSHEAGANGEEVVREPELKVAEVAPEKNESQVENWAKSIQNREANDLERESARVFVRCPIHYALSVASLKVKPFEAFPALLKVEPSVPMFARLWKCQAAPGCSNALNLCGLLLSICTKHHGAHCEGCSLKQACLSHGCRRFALFVLGRLKSVWCGPRRGCIAFPPVLGQKKACALSHQPHFQTRGVCKHKGAQSGSVHAAFSGRNLSRDLS